MLHLNAPPMSACHWDEPQCVQVALRYHNRVWPLQRWLGERLVIEVTDSKLDESPVHVMSLGRWDRFLRGVHGWRPDRRGQFRLGPLRFTQGEVARFTDGVDSGLFHRELAAT